MAAHSEEQAKPTLSDVTNQQRSGESDLMKRAEVISKKAAAMQEDCQRSIDSFRRFLGGRERPSSACNSKGAKQDEILAFFDKFKLPKLRYQNPAKSVGREV
jgi:hypothetical protein